MKNLATAVFLTFIFCAVSANGKDLAKGSHQNTSSESATSSLMSDTKKLFGKVKSFFGFDEPVKAGRASNQKQNGSSGRISGKNRQLNYNRSFRDSLWEEKMKDWEKRHSPVPQSLPRATFKLNKQSSSRSFRSSHRSSRSFHSHRTRHVRRGRTHVRRRSRR